MENIRERERTEVQGKGKTIGKKIKKQTKMRNQIWESYRKITQKNPIKQIKDILMIGLPYSSRNGIDMCELKSSYRSQ